MDKTQQLLQISAKLYQLLGEVPDGDERTEFIEELNKMLDERGEIVNALYLEGVVFDKQQKIHQILFELDKGIRERLNDVMNLVKEDMKTLQNTKKNESQYRNPYASVQVMDGRYYDRKK